MPRTCFGRAAPYLAPLIAAAACVLPAANARAGAYALGTVTGPATFSFEQLIHSDPFEDTFSFTVAPEAGLWFAGIAATGFSRRTWIHDLDGQLERGGASVHAADSQVIWSPEFPRTEATFSPFALEAGDYTIRVFGTPTYVNFTAAGYEANFRFSLAGPVPEPAAGLLAALGVLAVCGGARTRRGARHGNLA